VRKNYRDQFITTEVAIAELVPTSIAPTIAELSFGSMTSFWRGDFSKNPNWAGWGRALQEPS